MEVITSENEELVEARKWEDLNTDCVVKVLQRVELEALVLDVPLVCRSWYKASFDPQLWKSLDFCPVKNRRAQAVRCVLLSEFVKLVVKRSKGNATQVVVPSHWQRELKDIICSVAEGCPLLKSLTIPQMFVWESEITELHNLFTKWKDLECLKMSIYSESHLRKVLTQIRDNCKNFAALTTGKNIGNEEALSIVTLLPNIKYLTLSGSNLSRENLILILTKCRELELLDVRDCIGFSAADDEILKMASHINNFMSKGSMPVYSDDDEDYSDYWVGNSEEDYEEYDYEPNFDNYSHDGVTFYNND